MKNFFVVLSLLAVTATVFVAQAKPSDQEYIPNPEPTDKTTTAIPTVPPVPPTNVTTEPPKTTLAPNVTTNVPTTSTTTSTTTTTTSTTTTAKPITTTTPKPITTSPSPETTKVPVGPITTHLPNPTPVPHGRQFDGLSFMGGIILTACIVGLSVGGYKFYKIKTERSYRTL